MEVFGLLIKLDSILGVIERHLDAAFYSWIFSVDVIESLLFTVKQIAHSFIINYFLIFAVSKYI